MMDNPLVTHDLERVLHQERRRAPAHGVLADRPLAEVPRSAPTIPPSQPAGEAS